MVPVLHAGTPHRVSLLIAGGFDRSNTPPTRTTRPAAGARPPAQPTGKQASHGCPAAAPSAPSSVCLAGGLRCAGVCLSAYYYYFIFASQHDPLGPSLSLA